MAELSEVKKLVLSLSDREIMALLGLQNNKNGKNPTTHKGLLAAGSISRFPALTVKDCLT